MKEVIILAGGKGTRLQSITKGGQKVVVKIGSKSFLELLLERLDKERFDSVHLALGHCAEEVKKIVSSKNLMLRLNFIQESRPLGTGGAIKNALQHVSVKDVIVINGDSLNDINYTDVLNTHQQSTSDISILTKIVPSIARYGEVQVGPTGRIIRFAEKTGLDKTGNINTGVYVLPSNLFDSYTQDIFSFELFLSENVSLKNIGAIKSEGRFVDIGTPTDYYKFISSFDDENVYE